MAHDRYDTREDSRGQNPRWRDDEQRERSRSDPRSASGHGGGSDDRGFFERAGDEIASWFGDDDAEHRRRHDHMEDQRSGGGARDYDRGYGRDYNRDRERSAFSSSGRSQEQDQRSHGGDDRQRSDRQRDRGQYEDRGTFAAGGSSERDYTPGWKRELRGGGERSHDRSPDRGGDYRPMAGDYGRGAGDRGMSDEQRSQTPYGRDQSRRTSFAGSADRWQQQEHDPHYHAWKQRHMDELDRDYDDYRKEHQSKFESDFGSWRNKRQSKRQMLGRIREHMDVVGNDDKHVGTVDRVAGDRIILTKSDPESGGVHHSLSCSEIDRVEDNRVILDCSADQARQQWRDESRSRALFEREDQGEMGPHILDRSFEGTYR